MCRLYIIKIFRKSHGVYVLYVHSWDYGRGSDGMRPQTHARNGASRMIIYMRGRNSAPAHAGGNFCGWKMLPAAPSS